MSNTGKQPSAQGGITPFQKHLTFWVVCCMIVGALIGQIIPQVPEFLGQFELAHISIPMAILVWLMIFPMMMKVDFKSIKNVGKNPKGLVVTWVVNWLIKPFTMYLIASAFLFGAFKALIAPDLAVAVAIALFGASSPAALATTVGVLTEVPVMLLLVRIANATRNQFTDK